VVTFAINDAASANEYDPLADQTRNVDVTDNDAPVIIPVPVSTGGAVPIAFLLSQNPTKTNQYGQSSGVNNANLVLSGKQNIQLGKDNNSEEVKKLEIFLNSHEGEKLEVNGIYESADVAAVRRFQQKYYNDIIKPFGGKSTTGVVGTFTRGKINVLNLSKSVGCPYFTANQKPDSTGGDVKRIQNFINTLMGTTLSESGVFDEATFLAVKKYQTLYKETVLKPLNLNSATGLWYEKSRLTANTIVGCGL
jgi:hypothetical protein